ncbi:recombination protein RecR [Candidatus Gottesmanbacteria bacterium RBG_16_37_8]|uniref:Recombination protein RecR n=1 Tax=Candidatus Gottesmanbacteria bacterium RBG_16_37_8 TaxID=1798371 RepID=A0A1F5YS07_9BACT|nr:MAG: recombination protein RecR [Candidatus Gottesmanbacteria bacterium RBG_16_37_8]
MSFLPKTIEKLIETFQKLPGIGPKTAGRLTFYLLHMPQEALDNFSRNIADLKKTVVYCSICSNIAETDPCSICDDITRDIKTVCVVENPIEILSIEKTGKYKGVYHVLHGAINPLNNIGPDELKIEQLLKRISSGNIREIILATNLNMEGEATAMYIKREILNIKSKNENLNGISITRLAHGLPVGADLEYADEVTLSHALEGRREF